MAHIIKQAEILKNLHDLVSAEAIAKGTKVAELAQTNISGTPGKDTKVTSVSDKTETVDQNGVGPDKLNSEQGYEQKPSSDASEPVSSPKQAELSIEDVEKRANDILTQLENRMKEAALAQTNISGKPGKDTKITAVSDKTETVDQNAVGPDKLNKDQGYDQDKTKNKSAPVAKVKSSEETVVEEASEKLGSLFSEALIKRAAAYELAKEKNAEEELIKEAGRRDVDMLIASTVAELEAQQKQAEQNAKNEEAQGAAYFDELYKKACVDAIVEENKQLREKVAGYAELEKQAELEKAAKAKEDDMAKLATFISETIKRELVNATAPATVSK
jgi:hypothetical protein